jgi:hypothetical protein
MALTQVRAAALADRLDLSLDRICLACLSFVSSAINSGDPADVQRWVRRMTPELWSDGLDADAVEWLMQAEARGEADATEALADLERSGGRSAVARAIVFRLGDLLARYEREHRPVLEEVMRAARSSAELN